MTSISPPPRYSPEGYGTHAEKPFRSVAPAAATDPTQPKTEPPKGAANEKKSTIKEVSMSE